MILHNVPKGNNIPASLGMVKDLYKSKQKKIITKAHVLHFQKNLVINDIKTFG